MDFARNAAERDAMQRLLALHPPRTDATLWALVDMALLERRRVAMVARAQGWSLSNALQGTPLEAYGEHAPVWIALSGATPAETAGLTRLLVSTPCAPAISLVTCHGGLQALSSLSAYLARARIGGDMLTHCRFADTRVLPSLLARLTASQQARVGQAVATWAWIDHLGEARAWHAAAGTNGAAPADASEHLELDATQFAAMLDASEPDTMFSLLCEHTPELVPDERRGEFRDVLASILARADQRQLEAANDRLQFIVLSLSCRDGFDDDAGLEETWRGIAQRKTTLVEAMASWSDAQWDRLQARAPGPSR
jgi:hypothetical protein